MSYSVVFVFCIIAALFISSSSASQAKTITPFLPGENWTSIAFCPTFDGHSSLCQHTRYIKPWQTAVDVDMFDTPASTIAALRDQGHKVICYIDAGAWESYRPDANQFPNYTKRAQMNGWPGEWWLDIFNSTSLAKIKELMGARMDLAVQKGCQAMDFDDVDCFNNPECLKNESFAAGAELQLQYNRWLALEAHKRGMSAGLKNDLLQVAQLEPYFDFAINEQCGQYDQCQLLLPFINNKKAVFQIEYSGSFASVCSNVNQKEGSGLFNIIYGASPETKGLWWYCAEYSGKG